MNAAQYSLTATKRSTVSHLLPDHGDRPIAERIGEAVQKEILALQRAVDRTADRLA